MRNWMVLIGGMLLGGLVLSSGCATARAPVNGFWYSDVKDGALISGQVGCSKNESAMATSYLGLIATGDASIKTAMDKGGITKIHHVDYHSHSIFGIIAHYTVTVYGE